MRFHDDEDESSAALLRADPNLATEGDKEAADDVILRAQREVHLRDYDVPEVNVLQRMKRVLIKRHDWEAADFDGMDFTSIEAEFLEVEPDFRGDAG